MGHFFRPGTQKKLDNLRLIFRAPSGKNESILFSTTQKGSKYGSDRKTKALAYVNKYTEFKVDQRGKPLTDKLPSTQTTTAAITRASIKTIQKKKNKKKYKKSFKL